jgi:hypothetical protein
MERERLVRLTLWATVFFNLLAAGLFLVPSSSLGQLAGLPRSVPALYAVLTAYLVAFFAVAYAWLAAQPQIHRPPLAFFALGKIGVFVVATLLWLAGNASWRVVLLASGDLAFGLFWLSWLFGGSRQRYP